MFFTKFQSFQGFPLSKLKFKSQTIITTNYQGYRKQMKSFQPFT